MTDADLRTVLADRVSAVRARMAAACRRVNRDPAEVTLIAVTKTVSPRVAGVLPELGVRDLAENRPQELWRKAEALKALPIWWHMIGHLQRNKVERTVSVVNCIHSIDSLRLARAVADEHARTGRSPVVFLQVNISGEQQKQGFDFDELLTPEFAELRRSRQLNIQGLMGMAAYSDDPEQARPAFAALRQCRDRLRTVWTGYPPITELSMGMSGDFEVAIEEGATLVRVGTTLFEGLEGE